MTKLKPQPFFQHQDQYAMPVMFNPYSGRARRPEDIESDPYGELIVPPGGLLASQGKAQP